MSEVDKEIIGWLWLVRLWFSWDKRLEIVRERGMSVRTIDLCGDFMMSFFSFVFCSVGIEVSCPICFYWGFRFYWIGLGFRVLDFRFRLKMSDW